MPLVPASLENSMSFREDKVGFLGATSYSAVFTENRGSLGIVDPGDVRTVPFSLVLAQQPRPCCRVWMNPCASGYPRGSVLLSIIAPRVTHAERYPLLTSFSLLFRPATMHQILTR